MKLEKIKTTTSIPLREAKKSFRKNDIVIGAKIPNKIPNVTVIFYSPLTFFSYNHYDYI
jgi:hypothetical protein